MYVYIYIYLCIQVSPRPNSHPGEHNSVILWLGQVVDAEVRIESPDPEATRGPRMLGFP